jgi:hypothetical protein
MSRDYTNRFGKGYVMRNRHFLSPDRYTMIAIDNIDAKSARHSSLPESEVKGGCYSQLPQQICGTATSIY